MAAAQVNPVNPQCNAGLCLQQVAGFLDYEPQAYIASCQSAFGIPVVPTVTVPSDPIFSTEISTSTYIDIVISTSFETSTVDQTSTVYEYVSETATEYTTTILNTLTSTAPAVVSTLTTTVAPVKKRGPNKKRYRCKSRTHSTTTTSSAPTSSSVPIPESCADLAEFSSACACLELTPVTSSSPPSTTVVTSTVPSTVQSTTETVVTVAVTSVIVSQIQTTTTSTLTTETATTTTTTTTDTPAPTALQSGSIAIVDGPSPDYTIHLSNSAPAYYLSAGASTPNDPTFIFGQPALTLASDTSYGLYIRMSTSSYGVMFITTPSYITTTAYTWVTPTCSVEPGTQKLTCTTGTYALTHFWQCNGVMYMANTANTPGGCAEVHLKGVDSASGGN
ncbi:hypothetical protein QBC47DRAFT_418203 [Echria macrotheca]|uniref:Uncharacterized protein n=1 Tax=Echria macrotheca TaxID=438768 RepID=A0AAJ0B2K0_9PEZI|nr:hypothetical protein QBC47DRAFT_418203 [Echria macrotheca]